MEMLLCSLMGQLREERNQAGHSLSDVEMQRCRAAEMQRCRDAEMQRCRDAEMQRCRDAEVYIEHGDGNLSCYGGPKIPAAAEKLRQDTRPGLSSSQTL